MMKFKINESKRDDLLLRYMELLNNNGINVNIGQVKSKLLNKFVVEGNFHNLSLRSNYYLAGVARYYFDGSLTKNKDLSLLKPESWQGQDIQDIWDDVTCKKLDALINVLRNAYIDTIGTNMLEPEDFGELPLKDLLKKYNKEIRKELGVVTKKKSTESEIDTNENVGNGYTFEIMYSQADCQKYERPTAPGSWCITYGQCHYDVYVNRLNIHYVIFKRNGWENIERPKNPLSEPGFTPEKPHDAYGNSLIAMLQSNTSPEPVFITSRWNHGYEVRCEADHAYTKKEFQQITGVTDDDLKRIYNIWNVFKTKKKSNSIDKKEENFINRSLKYLQMRINSGENPGQLFNHMSHIFGNQKMNKGTFICSAKLSETTMAANERLVYFIFDNGKIIFDTACIDSSSFTTIKDLLVIIKKNDSKHLMYSLQHHKLLSINGTNVFRRIPDFDKTGYNVGIYFEVKQGYNDVALFNGKTMEPLQLPNGEYWFNKVKCNTESRYERGNQITCNIYTPTKSTCFTIYYDISSSETYFYNTETRNFFEPKMPNEIKFISYDYGTHSQYIETYPSDGLEPFLDNTYYSRLYDDMNASVIGIRYGKRRVYQTGAKINVYYGNESAVQYLVNGKLLYIDGECWFKKLELNETGFNILYLLNGKKILMNQNITKYLNVKELDNNYDFNIIRGVIGKGGSNLFMFTGTKNNSEKSMLYNVDSNEFLLSPKSDSILFNGVNCYVSRYDPEAKKVRGFGFRFSNKREVPTSWWSFGDVDGDGLIMSFDDLNVLCEKKSGEWTSISNDNNTIPLNRLDVEKMVNESLKRVLKRIISA